MTKAEQLQKLFGVDVSDLTGHALEEPDYPDTTPGRVLHIDGDFLAYQVSADDSKSVSTMMHNHDVAVETLRLLAGAEHAVCHLTASHGDKGKRYELAIQKEYQSNRKGKAKPKHLHTIKSWMEEKREAINHVNQEADDGLSQANWEQVVKGTPELSVLVSKDKDLQMCQGLHLDWDTGDLEEVSGFGYIKLDRSKSSPKVTGKGSAFFWAQMLMGDGADNIQGLPLLHSTTLNAVKPTKATTLAQKHLKACKALNDCKKCDKAKNTLAKRKPSKCGPVIVYDILKNIKTDKTAFTLVKALYKKHGEEHGFKHWETGEDVHWGKVLLSEAQLLWMRRFPHENDVLGFFKGIE
jgi:hypothetical protein